LIDNHHQPRITVMIAFHDPSALSPQRRVLCSSLNAQRIAARMVDDGTDCVSIVRTGNPLQPLRIVAECVDGADVELEMRLA